jgi:hypothetical protein
MTCVNCHNKTLIPPFLLTDTRDINHEEWNKASNIFSIFNKDDVMTQSQLQRDSKNCAFNAVFV